MFKSVILPIKFDCFVGWVVGVEILTGGGGVYSGLGIHGEGVPPVL